MYSQLHVSKVFQLPRSHASSVSHDMSENFSLSLDCVTVVSCILLIVLLILCGHSANLTARHLLNIPIPLSLVHHARYHKIYWNVHKGLIKYCCVQS